MWAYGKSRIPPVWSKKIPADDLGLGQYEVPPEMWPGLKRITPTGARSAVGCTACGGLGDFELPAFVLNPWFQFGVGAIGAFALLKLLVR
jgi:hypothetical protein